MCSTVDKERIVFRLKCSGWVEEGRVQSCKNSSGWGWNRELPGNCGPHGQRLRHAKPCGWELRDTPLPSGREGLAEKDVQRRGQGRGRFILIFHCLWNVRGRTRGRAMSCSKGVPRTNDFGIWHHTLCLGNSPIAVIFRRVIAKEHL